MKIPGFIIAGTNSGCGKTTISLGIMAALSKRGLKVKPFKVGPDYIDPMFHSFVTGLPSTNLDSWMLDENTVKYLYNKNSKSCSLSLIEGVMGFYDGLGGTSIEGSTAHLAKIIKTPVVLVVNGEGMSLSIGAIVNGFRDFDIEAPIKGVIINKIKSQSHYSMLKEIIENHCGIKVYGFLNPLEEISLKSRHLGLVTSAEIGDLEEKIAILVAQIEETIDLNGLVELANDVGILEFEVPKGLVENPVMLSIKRPLKIGIAKDKAFCFYYNDNLRLLEELGVKLIEFSPLSDDSIPQELDGLYIGGGYPEVYAKELSQNTTMKNSIKTSIEKGLPAYAECGGLMYLSKAIQLISGEEFEMVGMIPGITKMTKTLTRFGYIKVEATMDNSIAKAGQRIRGHEFHYSSIDVKNETECSWKVTKKRNSGKESSWICGFKKHNLLAAYPHLHFYSNLDFAKQFLETCLKFQELRQNEVL